MKNYYFAALIDTDISKLGNFWKKAATKDHKKGIMEGSQSLTRPKTIRFL